MLDSKILFAKDARVTSDVINKVTEKFMATILAVSTTSAIACFLVDYLHKWDVIQAILKL